MMRRRIGTVLAVVMVAVGTSSCASVKRDRCYLAETRYMTIKQVFEQTGSYQRAAQAMEDSGWSHCEKNSFRLRLREDFDMNDKQFDAVFAEMEPERRKLDFNPGRVEKVTK